MKIKKTYRPKTEAEVLKPLYPVKTFPDPDCRCRECEGLYLAPPGCDYTVEFSHPDCGHCNIDNPASRIKKAIFLKEKVEKKGDNKSGGDKV